MDQGQDDRKVNPLENSLVIRKVLSNLSTKELLGVSLVNKFWNYEARCVLRDQKKCVAVIKGDKPCLRARELNDMLGSLAVIPFNGLDVTISKDHKRSLKLCDGKPAEFYGNLLKMPLKYLKFEWNFYYNRNRVKKSCVLGQFIWKLISKSLTLEHLEIILIPSAVASGQEDP